MEPSYVKLEDRVGKYIWVNECEPDENTDPHRHFMQFNGSYPYYVSDDGEYVHIYIHIETANATTHPLIPNDPEFENDSEFEIDETDYCFEYVFSYKYDHFVDISYKYTNADDELCVRPYLSWLIALNDTRYLYISDECIEFESDGKITESIPEGCGDSVPYWFAFDDKYMYADDNGRGIVKIHKLNIDLTRFPLDPYNDYVYTSRDDKNKTLVSQITVSKYNR